MNNDEHFTNNRWMGIITLFLITVNIFTLVLWSNKGRKVVMINCLHPRPGVLLTGIEFTH
jgi:hypothetical protein